MFQSFTRISSLLNNFFPLSPTLPKNSTNSLSLILFTISAISRPAIPTPCPTFFNKKWYLPFKILIVLPTNFSNLMTVLASFVLVLRAVRLFINHYPISIYLFQNHNLQIPSQNIDLIYEQFPAKSLLHILLKFH